MVIIPWWRRVCAAHFEHHFPVSVGDFVDFRSISPVGWVSPRSLASKCSHPVKNSRNSPDRRTVTGGERFFRIGLVIHTTQRIYSIGKWIIIFMDLFFSPKKKGSIWRCPSSAGLPFVSRAFWRRCQDQKDSSEEPSDDSARRWDPGQCSKRSFGCSKSTRFPRRKVWRKESELLVLGC